MTVQTDALFADTFEQFGLPEAIRTDNGATFASAHALFGLNRSRTCQNTIFGDLLLPLLKQLRDLLGMLRRQIMALGRIGVRPTKPRRPDCEDAN